MKKILFFFLFSFSVWKISAQAYTVPGAQIQPAWVFPLWFEDGNGEKDTVYFCYDSIATNFFPDIDTLFGEKFIKKDSTKFWIGLWGFSGGDSTFQVYVSTEPFVQLIIHRGVYPLKMSWDDTLLYSQALPYPDLNPFPSARIAIICSDIYGNCPSDIELTITADSSNYFFPLLDNVIFHGEPGVFVGNTLGEFSMQLLPFDTIVNTVKEINDANPIIYPAIITSGFWMKFDVIGEGAISIFNTIGHCILQSHIGNLDKFSYFDLTNVPGDVYIVTVQYRNQIKTFKILKQ